jgi:hypothetical protein
MNKQISRERFLSTLIKLDLFIPKSFQEMMEEAFKTNLANFGKPTSLYLDASAFKALNKQQK